MPNKMKGEEEARLRGLASMAARFPDDVAEFQQAFTPAVALTVFKALDTANARADSLGAWQCAECAARFDTSASPTMLEGVTRCSSCVENEALRGQICEMEKSCPSRFRAVVGFDEYKSLTGKGKGELWHVRTMQQTLHEAQKKCPLAADTIVALVVLLGIRENRIESDSKLNSELGLRVRSLEMDLKMADENAGFKSERIAQLEKERAKVHDTSEQFWAFCDERRCKLIERNISVPPLTTEEAQELTRLQGLADVWLTLNNSEPLEALTALLSQVEATREGDTDE